MIFFISHKRYSIGEVLKQIFFRKPRIARLVAVERDVKPRNMNFAKVQKRGGGGLLILRGIYMDKYGISTIDGPSTLEN